MDFGTDLTDVGIVVAVEEFLIGFVPHFRLFLKIEIETEW